jgi:ABC-2 type transport system permease protein
MLFFFPQSILNVVAYLSASIHFENIAKGIVDSRDVLYFLSIVFIGLYATHLVMQEKK